MVTSLGEVIPSWDLELDKSINYRSLSPILHLARVDHTVECQLWAVWTMANLTTVMPEEYCMMVVEEGGLAVVEDIMDNHHHNQLKSLAETVRWERLSTFRGLSSYFPGPMLSGGEKRWNQGALPSFLVAPFAVHQLQPELHTLSLIYYCHNPNNNNTTSTQLLGWT